MHSSTTYSFMRDTLLKTAAAHADHKKTFIDYARRHQELTNKPQHLLSDAEHSEVQGLSRRLDVLRTGEQNMPSWVLNKTEKVPESFTHGAVQAAEGATHHSSSINSVENSIKNEAQKAIHAPHTPMSLHGKIGVGLGVAAGVGGLGYLAHSLYKRNQPQNG